MVGRKRGVRAKGRQQADPTMADSAKKDEAMVILAILMLSAPVLMAARSNPEYTYFGAVPTTMYRYVLSDETNPNSPWHLDNTSDTVVTSNLVTVVALEDDTNVQVFDLRSKILVSETKLDAQQKLYTSFPNGTFFKVVSDHLVSVMLLDFEGVPLSNVSSGPLPNTFYASTDGAYVGKDFVFMASQFAGIPFRIFALEKAEITIQREDGFQESYSLDVNGYKDLMLRPFATYRVESTGNIMIQSGAIGGRYDVRRSFFVPSAEGGFVGTMFFSGTTTDWDPEESYGFRISATEETRVTIWNLDTKQRIEDITVSEEGVGVKPKATAIAVQSDKPITLAFLHNGTIRRILQSEYGAYGAGVTYIGIRPNEETPFYLPTDSDVEAYIFAYERTQVTIDDIPRTIEGDSYFLLSVPGNHKVVSNKNVVVQIIHWPMVPEFQGLQYDGTLVPCIQTVGVVQEVNLTRIEEGFPLIYVIVAAAAAVALAGAWLILKGRGKKAT